MFIYHINISLRNGAKKVWKLIRSVWWMGPFWKVIMALQIAFTLWETREHQFGNFRPKKITNIDHTISYYTYSFNVVYRLLLLLFGWILYTIFWGYMYLIFMRKDKQNCVFVVMSYNFIYDVFTTFAFSRLRYCKHLIIKDLNTIY